MVGVVVVLRGRVLMMETFELMRIHSMRDGIPWHALEGAKTDSLFLRCMRPGGTC